MSELPPGARALVVTASNRAAAGVYEDRSGRALAAGLAAVIALGLGWRPVAQEHQRVGA